jgi:hypothetical protein
MRDESSPSLKHSLSTSLVEKKSSGSVGIATQWMTASVGQNIARTVNPAVIFFV